MFTFRGIFRVWLIAWAPHQIQSGNIPKLHHFIKTRLFLAPKNQDDNSCNFTLNTSKWTSTNTAVTLRWVQQNVPPHKTCKPGEVRRNDVVGAVRWNSVTNFSLCEQESYTSLWRPSFLHIWMRFFSTVSPQKWNSITLCCIVTQAEMSETKKKSCGTWYKYNQTEAKVVVHWVHCDVCVSNHIRNRSCSGLFWTATLNRREKNIERGETRIY